MKSSLPVSEFCCALLVCLLPSCGSTFKSFTKDVVPKPGQADVVGIAALTSSCEVSLQLVTWDKKVLSEEVCVKEAGQPLHMPERIALHTALMVNADNPKEQLFVDKTDPATDATFKIRQSYTANTDVYCEPGLSNTLTVTAPAQQASDGAVPCVWNRQVYDNYPIDLVFRSKLKAPSPAPPNTVMPLATSLSLIRIIRNAREIYKWTPGDSQGTATELRIPGKTIASPEHFNAPVELGLYVLPSGADQTKAAIAVATAPTAIRWQDALSRALQAAGTAAAPPEARQLASCLEAKVEYLAAMAGELSSKTDAEFGTWKAKADAAQKAIDAITQETTLLKASTPGLTLAALVEGPPPTGNAATHLDGVALPAGSMVGFFTDLENRHVTLRKYQAGAPWQVPTLADVPVAACAAPPPAPAPPACVAGGKFTATVGGGSRAGTELRITSNSAGAVLDAASIEPVSSKMLCDSPSAGLVRVHQDYAKALNAAVAAPALRKVGEIQTKAAALAQELGISASDLKLVANDMLQALPAAQRARVATNVGWLRQLDETIAALVDTARTFAANATDTELAVKAATKDPAIQLRAYQAATAALPTDETFYSKPVANPAPGQDEQALAMRFHRPRQYYLLLAWNAVPIPISGASKVKVEPRIEYLIPVIDVFGFHWQTGWSLVPVGGLGVGLMGTRETLKRDDGTEKLTAFNVGPQLNVSASGWRVGVSYLIREAEDCARERGCFADGKNFRVLLGADIVRLFTGKDTAVTTGNSGPDATTANK